MYEGGYETDTGDRTETLTHISEFVETRFGDVNDVSRMKLDLVVARHGEQALERHRSCLAGGGLDDLNIVRSSFGQAAGFRQNGSQRRLLRQGDRARMGDAS